MTRRIVIQSGHWNMTSGATGAPNEQMRTIAIGKRLVDLLRNIGVEVYHTDAFADSDIKVTKPDWDLFLALHCDANYAGDEGGGFVDWIDSSIDSSVASNKESERTAKAIEAVYFTESGIRNMPNRRNPNTKFYYMWNVLSANTHCVIIEMGESIDPHDNVILNDTERQAQILLRSIQNAYPDLKPLTPPVGDTTNNLNDQINQLKSEKLKLADELKVCQLTAKEHSGCQEKIIEATKLKNQAEQNYEKAKGDWQIKEVSYNKQISLLTTKYQATKSPIKKLLIDYIFGKN